MARDVPPETPAEDLTGPVLEAKAEMRRRAAALRRGLDAETHAARSRAACERLCLEPAFQAARTVCAYMPLRFELDITPAIEVALSRGKCVALPRVRMGTFEMSLHSYRTGDALTPSGFRVHEPAEDAPRVPEADVDLVIVPGLAFDAEGYRLGFGKGFYDRLLPRLGVARRIGIGFDFQRVDRVPHDVLDVPVHRFVSELRSQACEPTQAGPATL